MAFVFGVSSSLAQDVDKNETSAGYVPVIAGGGAYVFNVNGSVPTLEPQINPALLVPFGRHLLLESRVDFTGFFQRDQQTSGPYTGKIFKSVDFAQLDWLANTHAIVIGGKYLLPFGLYNERLVPVWIRNLQDSPITAAIGTRTSGAGDGAMLRGVAVQTSKTTTQYSAYFSARSGINQLGAARTAGGDISLFSPDARLEIGTSWQRFLQQHQINASATYVSWQPPGTSLDVKAEYDYCYNGRGYWIEGAYLFDGATPAFLRKVQAIGRMQEFYPLHGGGNSLPGIRTKRPDFGLNYYLRDNLRLISSYARSFSSQRNANVWNLGVTYRFTIPLWFGGKK
jgi:hypothetical protein